METQSSPTAKLIRDGVSQAQRLPVALDPEYVKIDERTEEDFRKFAQEFGKLVQFYDLENKVKEDATWATFFDETKQKTDNPHYALYLTFVHMLKYAQQDVNLLTGKHLNFYYQEVLQIDPKSAQADQAHVVLELARHEKNHILEKGTSLSAKKDANGDPVIFTTDEELVVNRTQISALRSIFLDRDEDRAGFKGMYAASVANSYDGGGEEDLAEDDPSFAAFGEKQPARSNDEISDYSMQEARIGFALASPLLRLSEGERTISLTFTLASANPDDPTPDLSSITEDDFEAYLTTKKGWLGPITLSPITTTLANNQFGIRLVLDVEQPAIVDYVEKAHALGLSTSYPVLQISLKNTFSEDCAYPVLEGHSIQDATLEVAATDMRSLIIQNEQSVEDPAKPFRVFGTSPRLGSSFLVGHPEVFKKPLTSLNIGFAWEELPDEDYQVATPLSPPGDFLQNPSNRWANHYQVYIPDGETLTENSFTCTPEILYRKEWVALDSVDPVHLFQTESSAESPPESVTTFSFSASQEELSPPSTDAPDPLTLAGNMSFEGDPEAEDFTAFGVDLQRGFIRFTLDTPKSPIRAFGHKDYPGIYATQIAKIANPDDNGQLPNAPYTPTGSQISLSYKSSTQFIGSDASDSEHAEQFFHLEPFGFAERDITQNQPLLPNYGQGNGYFYLGLENLDPPQNLSILFQVKDGSASPNVDPGDIQWSYLNEFQTWRAFLDSEILADSTQDLLKSGIIKFQIPKWASPDKTLMGSPGTYWFRGYLPSNPNSVNRLVGAHTQAVSATYILPEENEENQPNTERLAVPMAAGTIDKLVTKRAAIKSVAQPYASFGGSMREEDSIFYTRVSERLRHKNRAINLWDYERLVLEHFPSVYKVRCLPHTELVTVPDQDYKQEQPLRPGHVTLVVVSNLRNQNAVNTLEPTTSLTTLADIRTFLAEVSSPFLLPESDRTYIHVTNPIFERIQVDFKVVFYPNIDKGVYQEKLNTDIQRFLSPWAYDEGQDITFNGRIHRSMILNFVEELPYVDFVTDFKMYHYKLVTEYNPLHPCEITKMDFVQSGDLEEAFASVQSAILTSEPQHIITVMEADEACGYKPADSVGSGGDDDATAAVQIVDRAALRSQLSTLENILNASPPDGND